jgi:hypothetical protein
VGLRTRRVGLCKHADSARPEAKPYRRCRANDKQIICQCQQEGTRHSAALRNVDSLASRSSRPSGCLRQSPERLPSPPGCPPEPNIRLPLGTIAQSRGFCRVRHGFHKHADSALTSRALLVTLNANYEVSRVAPGAIPVQTLRPYRPGAGARWEYSCLKSGGERARFAAQIGPWLSLVERLNGVQEVESSNLSGPIFFTNRRRRFRSRRCDWFRR